MENNFKEQFFKKWATFSPNARTIVAAGGVLVLVMGVGSLFFKDLTPPKKKTDISASDLKLPGTHGELTNETLAAKIDSLIQSQSSILASQKTTKDDLFKLQQEVGSNTTNTDVAQLRSQVSNLTEKKGQAFPVPASKTDPLDPALNLPIGQAAPSHETEPTAEEQNPPIRVLASEEAPVKSEDQNEDAGNSPPYLPIGSMFDAVLINGMDAPTSQVTMKNPVPALLRVKSDAILPNEFRKDVRECFLIVSGYGVLSTERAQLRTESISCISKDGGVIESKLNGYVVGEDGKVGMRGRLVSKQGQLIAQSLLVGFVQGIGNAMQPMTVPQMNLNPGSTAQYQMPSASMMAMAGTAGGISQAANSIASFYLKMAEQIFPIVELDAGRKVTVILTRGLQFDLSGKYKKPITNPTQAVSVQQGPVTLGQSMPVPANGTTFPLKQASEIPAMGSINTGSPQGINSQQFSQ